MAKTDKRQASKMRFSVNEDNITNEDIKMGSLQRIADGVELMANNFLQMQSHIKYLEDRRYKNLS